VITAIRFKGVGISALGSLLTGGTSAFARNAVGFVHSIERRLQSKGMTLGNNRRVAIGVENYLLHQGSKNYSAAKMALSRPWKNQGNYAGSVLDYEWKCNAVITLLILSDGVIDTDSLQNSLRSIVLGMRFANGSIFIINDEQSFINIVGGNDEDSLKSAIKSVKASQSYFLANREDLVTQGNEFDSFADALGLFDMNAKAEEDKSLDDETISDVANEGVEQIGDIDKPRKSWARSQPGWIVPIERGYLAATKPVKGRPGIRDASVDSYIVTPVISLGEYMSAKRIADDLDAQIFWSAKSDFSVGSFLFNSSSFNQ
jgi:CRISPR type I-F-associated protein Csy2